MWDVNYVKGVAYFAVFEKALYKPNFQLKWSKGMRDLDHKLYGHCSRRRKLITKFIIRLNKLVK